MLAWILYLETSNVRFGWFFQNPVTSLILHNIITTSNEVTNLVCNPLSNA